MTWASLSDDRLPCRMRPSSRWPGPVVPTTQRCLMRSVLLAMLVVLALAPTDGHARCGDLPEDATALATVAADVSAACDCCGLRSALRMRRCARPLVKEAVVDGRVPRRCIHRALHDA